METALALKSGQSQVISAMCKCTWEKRSLEEEYSEAKIAKPKTLQKARALTSVITAHLKQKSVLFL